eukprot:CAMPEP_0117418810 /NCGR_PEP_ID=MMETSP0758-20121206/520_1 /TAXON_ID=63605 /ORGANISM="Percolomonas cosmopolitus, Strain AE-1 (ATCC 50343)" /LENGTH=544 /DNA_ID=CAMNT_0005199543 /DNA_START=689 /DNA_END=2319 /DNA_ORIENTATION=+
MVFEDSLVGTLLILDIHSTKGVVTFDKCVDKHKTLPIHSFHMGNHIYRYFIPLIPAWRSSLELVVNETCMIRSIYLVGYQPHPFNEGLSNSLRQAFLNDAFCELSNKSISLGGHSVDVHRCIIAARVPSLLDVDEVTFDKPVSDFIVKGFFEYIYGDVLPHHTFRTKALALAKQEMEFDQQHAIETSIEDKEAHLVTTHLSHFYSILSMMASQLQLPLLVDKILEFNDSPFEFTSIFPFSLEKDLAFIRDSFPTDASLMLYDGSSFPVHRFIMAARSEMFEAILLRWQDGEPLIDLDPDFEKNDLPSFLDMLYQNHVLLDETNAFTFFFLSAQYGIRGFDDARALVAEKVDEHTVLDVFSIAFQESDDLLMRACRTLLLRLPSFVTSSTFSKAYATFSPLQQSFLQSHPLFPLLLNKTFSLDHPHVLQQWVTSVHSFSTEYNADWKADYVIGPPTVYPKHGDIKGTWAPRQSRDTLEFITVKFATPVFPLSIDVYETYNPGSLIKVEALTSSNTFIPLFESPVQENPGKARIFSISLDPSLDSP